MRVNDNVKHMCASIEEFLYKVLVIKLLWINKVVVPFEHNCRNLSAIELENNKFAVRYYDRDDDVLYTLCFNILPNKEYDIADPEFNIISASAILKPGVAIVNKTKGKCECTYGEVLYQYHEDNKRDDQDNDLRQILLHIVYNTGE